MEKVKILFFADSHLGYDHPIRATAKTRRRGPDFFRNFDHVLNTATKEKVDLVIHGGDLFDRSQVHSSIVNKAYDQLFAFADGGIPLILIPGNHDRSTLPSSLFLQHPNLHIFFEPQVFSIPLKNQRFHIGGFPFIRNIGEEISTVLRDLENQLPSSGTSILCMHQAIQGATVGPGNYRFQSGPQVISRKELESRFHLYLSGHIHRHQILSIPDSSGTKLFVYPGSIERTSFAEREEEKGFVLLEYQGKSTPRITFQPLPSRPMQILKIADEEIKRFQLEALLTEKLATIHPESVLQIDSPTTQISNWLKDLSKEHVPGSIFLQIRHRWLIKS
jgi:DNA repair exonuclease SbcCD nuclease subunit